jgi:hypothetical protein
MVSVEGYKVRCMLNLATLTILIARSSRQHKAIIKKACEPSMHIRIIIITDRCQF